MAFGYKPLIGTDGAHFNFEDYADNVVVDESVPPKCETYLNKIKNLCDENETKLLIVKFPPCLWAIQGSSKVRNWANSNGIDFLDFNVNIELQKDLDIDWECDSFDGGKSPQL